MLARCQVHRLRLAADFVEGIDERRRRLGEIERFAVERDRKTLLSLRAQHEADSLQVRLQCDKSRVVRLVAPLIPGLGLWPRLPRQVGDKPDIGRPKPDAAAGRTV